MTNPYIEPTFASDEDRLLFLSKLHGVEITTKDADRWAVHLKAKPVQDKGEPDEKFWGRYYDWDEQRRRDSALFYLSKWDAYRLGKVQSVTKDVLDSKVDTAVDASAAQDVIAAQLESKFADKLGQVDMAVDLLPLVTGLAE